MMENLLIWGWGQHEPKKGYIRQGILEGRPRFWDASADVRTSADVAGNGVTAGSKNLTYRAHAFRMTLVAQGKLPQTRFEA